jgi:N-acetyl-anhydromuramyl-L-alanine amidase AmpD
MASPTGFQFDLVSAGKPLPFQLFEQLYPGVQDYWARSTSRRISDPILGVTTVVLHATAGGDCEDAMSVMKARKASCHWLVPGDKEHQHGQMVWACAPEARAALHVRNGCSHPDVEGGRTGVNHFSLGICIVNRQAESNPNPFSQWQVFAAAEIIRHCWAKYPNLKHVVSHARLDPLRRRDPGSSFPWDTLRDLVVNAPVTQLSPLAAMATPMSLLPKTKSVDLCCV